MNIPAHRGTDSGRMIDIGGRRLHVNIAGQGSPTVILEAGIAASSLSWVLVANRIAEFATVMIYDRAGLGGSDAAPRRIPSSGHRGTALDAARDLTLLAEKVELRGP